MHGFEVKWFAMQFRRGELLLALKLPREHCGVVFVVAQRFAVWRLVLFAKMRAG
jgi:hypothetical protein